MRWMLIAVALAASGCESDFQQATRECAQVPITVESQCVDARMRSLQQEQQANSDTAAALIGVGLIGAANGYNATHQSMPTTSCTVTNGIVNCLSW